MRPLEFSRLINKARQRIALFRMIRRHRKLADKRSLSLEQNKAAKYVMWIMGTLGMLYLCFIAVMFSLIANESRDVTPVELICSISPFVLALDFFFRFALQEIPAQLVKPYVLQPISRYACIDNFIGTSLLSGFNFVWFALLVPYVLMSIVFSAGIVTALGVLLFYWLLILVNTQWYHIVRTLTNEHVLWWLLPTLAYAALAMPWYIGKHASIEKMLDCYAGIGTLISDGSALPYAIPLAMLLTIVLVNRRMQYNHIMTELTRTGQTRLRSISSFAIPESLGETGLYLQLELKTVLRNKNPRKNLIGAISLVLMFSLALTFTDIYDGKVIAAFLGCYNFVIFGATNLSRIMCNEGNYIDCLMVHKENILSLLKAKYIFYCAVLLIPLLLMMPTVFTGKWSLLSLCAYAVFTAGAQYFILFQMAVYNKQAIPLNTKYMGKGGMGNNYRQVVVSMGCLIMPSILITILDTFMEEQLVYLTLMAIGMLFILTSNYWLRNIYNRMMHRKYLLMEGFQSSR